MDGLWESWAKDRTGVRAGRRIADRTEPRGGKAGKGEHRGQVVVEGKAGTRAGLGGQRDREGRRGHRGQNRGRLEDRTQ